MNRTNQGERHRKKVMGEIASDIRAIWARMRRYCEGIALVAT